MQKNIWSLGWKTSEALFKTPHEFRIKTWPQQKPTPVFCYLSPGQGLKSWFSWLMMQYAINYEWLM